jgi:hypothetical protein
LRITEFSFKGKVQTSYFPGIDNYFSNIDGYPMGWWHIDLKKYKNGVHSNLTDSVYIDMGETKIYTIPW